MKRVLSWVLTVCLLFALVPMGAMAVETVVESGSCGEGLQWAFYDSGLLQITGSGQMDYYNNTPEVPWFDYLAQITAVSFPEGLESLSHFTFYGCTGLTEVTFPQSLKSLGNSAFHGCTGLTEVVIPDSVTQLGAFTFSECANLERVELSDSLTGIGSEVFYFCKKLKSIDIPEGVTWIGEDAFCSCEAMTSVKLPQTLTSIGAGAFSGCWAIEDLDIPAGVETIGNDAFYGCRSYDELRIPEGACVGLRAFVGGQFTKFTLPDNVHCLGNFAFEGCDGITAVTIPSSLSFINYGLFYHCENLRDVTIPETIESIYNYAFSGCESLKYLVIPGSVKSIGDYALGYLENAEIRFRGDAPALGDWVFNRSVVTCYYPADNATWTEEVRQQYGGTVTWIPVSGCDDVHTWKQSFFEPTCTEDGYTLRVCQLCGECERTELVDALGHDYVRGQCSRCADTLDSGFDDVAPGSFYFDAVQWAVERGITYGTGDGFRPNDACTRAQIVTFLWRAQGRPEPKSKTNPFSDVSEKDYYYKAVLWAAEEGITHGVGGDRFAPHDTCNRAETVAFIWRAEGAPAQTGESCFRDVTDSDWYCQGVLWAVDNGITHGVSADRFGPYEPCNRAQIVTFLYRAAE